ncbi:MAG: hypothetical protein ACYS17_12015 [Planctomycetota bacterium]|jgi:hypothetical protein
MNTESQHYNQNEKRRAFIQPNNRRPLAHKEVVAAFKNNTQFPPLLSLNQAAQLAHFAPTTIKRLVSEGYFGNSVRRGKPIAFWRDRFVVEVMEMDKERKRKKNSKSQKGEQQK